MRTIILATAALISVPATAGVVVTYEKPRLQETTTQFDLVGIERFDRLTANAPNVRQSFDSDFETGGLIEGRYTNVNVYNATFYGGADGVGTFAHAPNARVGSGYTLDVKATDGSDLNYFGFWLSALDYGNNLTFYKDGQEVVSISAYNVWERIGQCPGTGYCSNPTPPFEGLIPTEAYAFVNVYLTDGQSYDRIYFFSTNPTGAFESDNHTVGRWIEMSGQAVPEAATWAMMIMGFGMVGTAMRRQRKIKLA